MINFPTSNILFDVKLMIETRMNTDLLRCKEAVAFLIWLLQVRNLPILFFFYIDVSYN